MSAVELLILVFVLVLLLGGGGLYLRGPTHAGIGLGGVLLIVLILYLLGAFR